MTVRTIETFRRSAPLGGALLLVSALAGCVSGSDIEPDQKVINEGLARQGRDTAASRPPSSVDPSDVKNTGMEPGEGSDKNSADAATG